MDSLYPLVLYANILQEHYIAEKFYLILNKSDFFLGWHIKNIFQAN